MYGIYTILTETWLSNTNILKRYVKYIANVIHLGYFNYLTQKLMFIQ